MVYYSLLDHPLQGGHDLLGGLPVAVQPVVHERGPGGSNDSPAAAAGHGGADEDTARPVGRHVVLVVDVLIGGVHDHGGALGRITKL